MPIITTCTRCGAELELDRDRILAGGWSICDACRLAQWRNQRRQNQQEEQHRDDEENRHA